ncbi:MAG TPA: ABC transporter ATP-binding protein [Candidatus Mediterraneibacter norfolkensis]|nr:ABC transporter ATP-binding protein [Candidatus Mediterraneibacter norfolkensis]
MELKIKGLTKDFKDFRAVDHVSCSMGQGVYGLLGVNGAGKTTLMRMICTLLKPTEGSVTWNGKDIFKMDASYRKVLGYLPQDFGFYPDFTVQDYMMYISSIKGLRPMTAKKRTETLLDQVGLRKMKKRKMRNLSGGMQRRVGIAQAMLNDPQILILDEPTAGLDPNERIRFRNLISELAGDRLVLLSTHIVSDVEFIANDILLMKDGKFFMNGTAEEIVSSMDQAVWSCTVPRKEADRYLSKYLVSNVKTVPGGAELRILAKGSPAEGAVMEEATLEDAFLLYFGEKAGEEHDGEV